MARTQITATTVLNNTNFETIDHTNKTLTVYAKWTACTYGETWEYDETNHWKVCTNCSGESAHVAHTFIDGICDICTYAREELAFSYDETTESYTVTGIGRIIGTDIVIPATYDDGTNGSHNVTTIGDMAFGSANVSNPSKITSVTMSNNITTIEDSAFYNCTNLSSITFSNNLENISWGSFYNCTSLTQISLPNKLETIGLGAFMECTNLSSVTLPSVKTIQTGGFYLCSSLTSITLPEGLEEIQEQAFGESGLTSINIPASVNDISSAPFFKCKMETITVNSENTFYKAINNCLIEIANKKIIAGSKNSIIPTDSSVVTMINDYAFVGTEVVNIVIPSNIEWLGEGAFGFCDKLVSVDLSNALPVLRIQTFYKCTSLKSIVIPSSIESLHKDAFTDCQALEKIFYGGANLDEWNDITFLEPDEEGTNSGSFETATIYYYSETEPTTTGKYWHYIDGVATPWSEKMTYKVEHYKEELDGKFEVASAETENKIGNINSTATATAKTFTGFTHTIIEGSSLESETITADGNLTLKVYYTRNSYTLTLIKGDNIASVSATETYVTAGENNTYTVKYGATVTLSATASAGYSFGSWSVTGNAVTVASDNKYTHDVANAVSITANATANTNTAYSVEYHLENLADSNHTKDEDKTVNTTGTTGAEINLNTYKISITGFEFDYSDSTSATISGNGNTIVKLYYKRATSTLTLTVDNGIFEATASGDGVSDKVISASGNNYTVKYGAMVTLSADVNNGYSFGSWSVTSGAVTISSGTYTHNTTANVEIKATATAKTYTLIFSGNATDSTISVPANQSVTYGSEIGPLPTATRTGYTFDDWYSETAYTSRIEDTWLVLDYVFDVVDHATQTVTIYANWIEHTYTIAFNANGGTGTMADIENVNYTQNKTLTNAFTKTGYTFEGWATSSTGSKVYDNEQSVSKLTTENDATITLYALWTPSTDTEYTIEYYMQNLAGNNFIKETSKTETKTGTTGETATITAKAIAGFTYDEDNSNVTSGNIAPDGSLVLKLYYTRNSYTLTLEKGTGIASISASGTYVTANTNNYTVKYGATVTLSATSSTGYRVGTWSVIDSLVTVSSDSYTHNVASNVTITANGTAKIYRLDHQTNGGDAIDIVNKTYNTAFTASELPTPTKTGYTFEGWYNDENFTTKVNVGDVFTAEKATFTNTLATIYAKWTENTYTIVFNGNGNTSGTMSNLTLSYSESASIPANAFEKTDNYFIGWSTSASSSTVAYANRATVSGLSATNNATINLYAVWTTSHTHSYNTAYIKDATYHWHECNCGEIQPSSKVEHTFKNGICNVCSYARDELAFSYVSNTATYTVTGIGRMESYSSITVPATYDDGTNGSHHVTKIANSAFKNKTFTSITLPDSITSIESGAFSRCKSLTSIIIPKNVASLGNMIFEYCNSLVSITVDEDNTTYYSDGNCLIHRSTKKIVEGCNDSTIPSDGSVEIIGDYAFKGRVAITDLVIPEGIITIMQESFDDCYYTTTISLPSTLRNMYANPFYCRRLESISIDSTNTYFSVVDNCLIRHKDGTLDDSTLMVGCINSIIPADGSVTIIGTAAFKDCQFTTFKLPDTITLIKAHAIGDCNKLESIVIPASVTEIESYAFAPSSALKIVYYEGSEDTWNAIVIDSDGNYKMKNATRYYYSETQPTTTGNYWHYVNGVPTAWTTSSSSSDE